MKKRTMKITGITVAAAAVLSLSFAKLSDREFEVVRNMDIFFSMFRELTLFYVDDTNPEELIGGGIEGMLATLDPYTVYIPEREAEGYETSVTGQYGGIGISIRDIEGAITVTDVMQNSASDRAGIRAGDKLMRIEGKWLTGKSTDDVSKMIHGLPGTELKIVYLQAYTEKEISCSLVREKITIPNVSYYGTLDEDRRTGYIRLGNFSPNAGREVKDALLALKEQHHIERLVLDLRSNPGGLLVEAVEVVNLFVKRGEEIVSTRGRVKQWDNTYFTRHEPVDTVIPLAVLVNRQTASAAEIVAGAIQDFDRGVIVGQRTYGKGLVQTTRPLSYNAQLKVTTAKYYIPSGRCIQALDYTHRESDGSVGHVPDSLIREYQTLNNKRTVRDGGGISPDIDALPATLSRIAYTLYVRNLIFDYATEYVHTHDTIAPANEFALDDREYAAYVAWLQDKSFDYETESERIFRRLKTVATHERYMEKAAEEFALLEAKMTHDRFADLELFKADVKELLEEEICSRYYYSAGRTANTLRRDNQLKMAVAVITTPDAYASVLNVQQ
jgi:carboxyl-terminal processing protease